MKFLTKFLVAVLLISMGTTAIASEHGTVRQDAEAIDVLQRMGIYIASLDRFAINSLSFSDARLDAGLIELMNFIT